MSGLMQIAEAELQQASTAVNGKSPSILCIPAHGKADEIAGELFVKAAARLSLRAKVLSTGHVRELIHAIEAETPAAVVISALLFSVVQARSLIELLRSRFPEILIVAGLWSQASDREALQNQVFFAGADKVARNFSDGIRVLAELIPEAA